MNKSRFLQVILGLAIAAAGLTIFFRDVDLRRLGEEFAQTHPIKLVWVGGLSLLTLWFRAIRWRFLLPDTKGATKKELFKITTIGFMVNNILPARLGEAVRVVLHWKRNHHSVVVTTGSIVVERIIDSFTFLVLFAVGTLSLPATRHLARYGYAVAAVAMALMVFVVLYVRLTGPIQSLLTALKNLLPEKIQPGIEHVARETAATLEWAFSLRTVIPVLTLSFLTSGCYVAMIGVMIPGSPVTRIFAGMVVLSFSVVGAAIPLAPGYVGTLHAMMLQGLITVGMPADPARAVAILYHACSYIPVTVVGLIFFFRLDLNFKDIAKAKEELRKEEEVEFDSEELPKGSETA